MVPRPIDGEADLAQVDATWGSIQPMNVATGVQTIGEKEVIDHLGQGLPVIDSRTGDFYRQHAGAAERAEDTNGGGGVAGHDPGGLWAERVEVVGP